MLYTRAMCYSNFDVWEDMPVMGQVLVLVHLDVTVCETHC